MKKPIAIALLMLMLLPGCREKEQEEAPETSVREAEREAVELPELMRLQAGYEAEIAQWEMFGNLEIEVKKFQKAGAGEGVLIVEDLLNLEKQLSASEFPEKFDIPAVKSRLLVLKTYLLQTKSLLSAQQVNEVPDHQKINIIEAFNAIKNQLAQTLTDDMTEQLLENIEEQLKDTVS